jgi:hypothetical protein
MWQDDEMVLTNVTKRWNFQMIFTTWILVVFVLVFLWYKIDIVSMWWGTSVKSNNILCYGHKKKDRKHKMKGNYIHYSPKLTTIL